MDEVGEGEDEDDVGEGNVVGGGAQSQWSVGSRVRGALGTPSWSHYYRYYTDIIQIYAI